MKIPKGKIQKITGFRIENKSGDVIFALNEVDFAYSEKNKYIPKIIHNDKARAIYNQLYKLFPK